MSPKAGIWDKKGMGRVPELTSAFGGEVVTPKTTRYQKLVNPRANMFSVIPTTTWLQCQRTQQRAISRPAAMPAKAPASSAAVRLWV